MKKAIICLNMYIHLVGFDDLGKSSLQILRLYYPILRQIAIFALFHMQKITTLPCNPHHGIITTATA